MAEIAKVIYQMELDNKQVISAINQTKNAYQGVEKGLKNQKGLMEDIEGELKRLEIARSKSTNPKDIERYNKKIAEGKKDLKEYATKGVPAIKKVNAEAKKGTSVFGSLGKKIAIAFSVGAVIAFAKASVKAFDVQATAEMRLLVALKGRKDVQQRLLKQAKELQKVTRFGDEETIAAQALLAKLLGDDEEAITRLTPLIQDLATAQKMDLRTAADLVAKSVGSSTNALSRYGVVIEGDVGSAERLESAVSALNKQVGGQAAAAAGVGAGRLIQLKNIWGDLTETIGNFVVWAITPAVKGLSNFIGFIDEAIKQPYSEKLVEEKNELNLLVNSVIAAGDNQEIRNKLIDELQIKYPSFLKNLDKEQLTTEKLTEALKAANIEYNKKISAAANEEILTEKTKELEKIQSKQTDILKHVSKSYEVLTGNYDETGMSLEQMIRVLAKGENATGHYNSQLIKYNELTAESLPLLNEIARLQNTINILTDEGSNNDGIEEKQISLLDAINKKLKAQNEIIQNSNDTSLREIRLAQRKIKLLEEEKDAILGVNRLQKRNIENDYKKILSTREYIDEVEILLGILKESHDAEIIRQDDIIERAQDTMKVITTLSDAWRKSSDDTRNALEEEEQLMSDIIDASTGLVSDTLSSLNTIFGASISELDGFLSIQSKRVDKARKLAETGNSAILELELENMDKLTKEREKFVRKQQALATIEIIANSAIAISKAATLPPPLNVIAIASTLAALASGLAAARQTASQAAFFEGGYTGDGNNRKTAGTVEHKEFVFDHKKTGQYRDIFEDVHKGRIDLREELGKGKMLDDMLANRRLFSDGEHRVIYVTPEKDILGKKIDDLTNAVKGQDRLNVSINEKGIHAIASKIQYKKDRINKLAR